jgi:hypothetical protein
MEQDLHHGLKHLVPGVDLKMCSKLQDISTSVSASAPRRDKDLPWSHFKGDHTAPEGYPRPLNSLMRHNY